MSLMSELLGSFAAIGGDEDEKEIGTPGPITPKEPVTEYDDPERDPDRVDPEEEGAETEYDDDEEDGEEDESEPEKAAFGEFATQLWAGCAG